MVFIYDVREYKLTFSTRDSSNQKITSCCSNSNDIFKELPNIIHYHSSGYFDFAFTPNNK